MSKQGTKKKSNNNNNKKKKDIKVSVLLSLFICESVERGNDQRRISLGENGKHQRQRKKKSGYVSKQWRKQGRMGRQQKGDWRKSHGKIRIRQREEKEKRAT